MGDWAQNVEVSCKTGGLSMIGRFVQVLSDGLIVMGLISINGTDICGTKTCLDMNVWTGQSVRTSSLILLTDGLIGL